MPEMNGKLKGRGLGPAGPKGQAPGAKESARCRAPRAGCDGHHYPALAPGPPLALGPWLSLGAWRLALGSWPPLQPIGFREEEGGFPGGVFVGVRGVYGIALLGLGVEGADGARGGLGGIGGPDGFA